MVVLIKSVFYIVSGFSTSTVGIFFQTAVLTFKYAQVQLMFLFRTLSTFSWFEQQYTAYIFFSNISSFQMNTILKLVSVSRPQSILDLLRRVHIVVHEFIIRQQHLQQDKLHYNFGCSLIKSIFSFLPGVFHIYHCIFIQTSVLIFKSSSSSKP